MIRKILSGLLVLALALCSAGAIAEQPSSVLPSATMPTQITAESIVTEESKPAEGLLVELSVIDETPAEDLFKDIQTAVSDQPILEYLGQEATEEIAKLQETEDTEGFVLAEMWVIRVETNQELPEIVKAVYQFPVEYTEETPLVGLVGIPVEETITWFAVPAEVEEGKVVLTFSQEILQKILENENSVFILLQGQA